MYSPVSLQDIIITSYFEKDEKTIKYFNFVRLDDRAHFRFRNHSFTTTGV